MTVHNCKWEFRVRSIRELGPERTDLKELYPTCSYCGSLSVSDFLDALEKEGTRYSGSDWKYGWPHKFYVRIPCDPYVQRISSGPEGDTYGELTNRSHKFYSTHLKEATEEELKRWEEVAFPLLGILFGRDDKGTFYRSPRRGYQVDGVIGATDV